MIDPVVLIKTVGLTGIFLVVFIETGFLAGFFLPGDSLLFPAGILASMGYISLPYLLIGVPICAILGDAMGYLFGRKVGYRIFFKENSLFFNKKYIS